MKISVKGKGVELTAALTDYVNNKFGKLERHSSLVSEIQVTLSVEKLVQKAEANVIVPGALCTARRATRICTLPSTCSRTRLTASLSATRKSFPESNQYRQHFESEH